MQKPPSRGYRGAPLTQSVCRGLEEIAAPFGEPLPEPHTEPSLVQVFQAQTLAALRQRVLRHAIDAGFDRSASEDLALGLTEMATNSVVHGGGGGVMRLWEEDATLVCEVSDTGRLDQPLAGRERPRDGQIGGFGLWLAPRLRPGSGAQLCGRHHGTALQAPALRVAARHGRGAAYAALMQPCRADRGAER